MGFMEILFVLVIAILFLGPDKLPTAMVEIAKFIKGIKKGVHEAKSALDAEIQVGELKEEAMKYKADMDKMTEGLNGFKNIDLGIDEAIEYSSKGTPVEPKQEAITFEKKSKKDKSKKDKIEKEVE